LQKLSFEIIFLEKKCFDFFGPVKTNAKIEIKKETLFLNASTE